MERKMVKIMYLTTSPQMGGAEKQLFELTKKIDKKDFEVLVCTIKSKEGGLLEKLRNEGINTQSLGLNKKTELLKVFKLAKIIRKFNPDIIQSFLFFDNILARIFGKVLNVPVVISGQRNVETHRSFLRNLMDKVTLRFADYVISNTEAGKKIVSGRERFDSSKVFVVPNGIDLSKRNILSEEEKKSIRDELGIKEDIFVVGFIGYLTKQKAVNYLIEAVKSLDLELKEKIKVLIIGEGEEKESLEKLSGGLEDKIHFLGFRKDASRYMSLFDVFVLPSLWEGQPNVLLEAMAYGVPIISTRVGGVEEMIKDKENGILVDPANSSMIKESLTSLFRDFNLREKLSKNGLEIVETYDVSKMVSRFETLYKKFMQDSAENRSDK